MILSANKTMLPELDHIARIVAKDLHDQGIDQWSETYPTQVHFADDIRKNGLFVLEEDHRIVGSISILPEDDPPYKVLEWTGSNALVIHRLMIEPGARRKGAATKLVNHAIMMAKQHGNDSIKVDTHPDNLRMQNFLEHMGFVKRGYLPSIHRIGYELVL